jgi:muconate cycloisomerase
MKNIQIERIESVIVDLPTIRPHHLSMAVMRSQTIVIVRLFCSDGIEGLGEATTIGGLSYGDESPEGMKLTIDTYIAPLLQGKSALSVNAIMAMLEYTIKGNHFVKSAIETALLDAQGRRLGISVATLLGGAVTQTLPVLWTLASGDTEKDIQEAHTLLENGRHKAFKLKIGRNDWKVDVAHVAAIKAAVGPDVIVTVDVNQAWTESVAKQGIAQLQDAGIDLIEQPIVKTNFDGLARLTQYFQVPIMADEAAGTVSDAFKLAKIGGGSVFALKISKAGGLTNIQKQAAIAQGAGISLYGGTMLEGTIGTVASAHVFSTLPHLDWGTELFGPLLLTEDIVKKRLTYGNGVMEIPQEPGLGVELDMNQVEKFKRR